MAIKPFKIKYCLERKDPDLKDKMHNVFMQFDDNGSITVPEDGHIIHTISYDENPASRLLPINTPTMIRPKKMALSAGIMSVCGLERYPCLQESTS